MKSAFCFRSPVFFCFGSLYIHIFKAFYFCFCISVHPCFYASDVPNSEISSHIDFCNHQILNCLICLNHWESKSYHKQPPACNLSEVLRFWLVKFCLCDTSSFILTTYTVRTWLLHYFFFEWNCCIIIIVRCMFIYFSLKNNSKLIFLR